MQNGTSTLINASNEGQALAAEINRVMLRHAHLPAEKRTTLRLDAFMLSVKVERLYAHVQGLCKALSPKNVHAHTALESYANSLKYSIRALRNIGDNPYMMEEAVRIIRYDARDLIRVFLCF